MPNLDWLCHTLAFIAIWTTGLFFVQARTLISVQSLTPRFVVWAPGLRLFIDICFTTAVSLLLPPVGLVIVAILTFIVLTGLTWYARYFLRPLSALTVYHNWREGAKAGRYRISWSLDGTVIIFGSLAILMITLVLTAPVPAVDPRVLWLAGGAALAGYLILVALASWRDPLIKIRSTRGIGRVGMARGYFITWLGEFFYLGTREVRESAIRQRQIVSDALTPIETSIPVRRQLIVIQVESLDFHVLGHEVAGQEVTPFLNQLRERSLFYRIAAARDTGSGDADFIMLNGVLPSPHVNTYNIPNYPYGNTLPQFLARFGYRTAAFHGNSGNFYNRRGAFEKMGFAEIHFEEEMIEEGLPRFVWGIEDKEVLDFSARLLRESNGPVCHFIITMTTHTPYKLLADVEREVVANPQNMADHYLNNMRYLDNRLRRYIGSLTSATVVLYSDHPADPALAPAFQPDCLEAQGRVPCLIFDTESDLGTLQRTRDQRIAQDGSLTLLDISSFLRAQVAAGNGPSHLALHGSGGWQVTSEK